MPDPPVPGGAPRPTRCDNCGAPLTAEVVCRSITCEYCHATTLLSPDRVFDHEIRLLLCTGCRAPLPAPPRGGRVSCRHCKLEAQLPPKRYDQIPRPADPPAEADRQKWLARQRLTRVVAQPSLLAFERWNGNAKKPKVAARALELWSEARSLLAGDSEDRAARASAELRLFLLTFCFSNYYSSRMELDRLRAAVETAYELCEQPRHKQLLLAMMARHAARAGDLEAAELWLADCDPRSTDIIMDTAWRYTRAYIDTIRGDFARVLEVLGATYDDVPVDALHNGTLAIYRANAHERLGDLETARRELELAASRVWRYGWMARVVANQPELDLVPKTFGPTIGPLMRRIRLRQTAFRVAWLGGVALLASQWALTRLAATAPGEALAALRLFSFAELWPALALFAVGALLAHFMRPS